MSGTCAAFLIFVRDAEHCCSRPHPDFNFVCARFVAKPM
jgi:hypothetical protein